MIGICGLLLGSCGKKENPGVEPPLPGPKPVSPELQRQAEKINAQMTTLRSLIGALARTELSSLREEESGTKLLFRDGTELTVVCSPSADGMPLIGVMPDGEAYYWTLAAGEKPQPLADEAGKRLPVSGDLPQLGVDGDGYWTLTAGERTPWRIVDAAGAPLRADEAVQTALFRSITEEAGRVEILLTDKTRLSTVRVTDLSAAGRANCYQVPAPGRYAFDATLRGNGVGDAATAGFDPKIELSDDMRAVWLWSDREGLVSEVELDRSAGEILFTAGAERGNAVIALLRGQTIVWSWHLWMTEPPQTMTCGSGASFMDRNLGARGATVGGTDAYGLYYQWGRKDPFYGGEKTETSSTAFAEAKRLTVVNPEAGTAWNIDKRTVTVGEAAAAPMTFFSAKVGATGAYDWLTQPVAGLWGGGQDAQRSLSAGLQGPGGDGLGGYCHGQQLCRGGLGLGRSEFRHHAHLRRPDRLVSGTGLPFPLLRQHRRTARVERRIGLLLVIDPRRTECALSLLPAAALHEQRFDQPLAGQRSFGRLYRPLLPRIAARPGVMKKAADGVRSIGGFALAGHQPFLHGSLCLLSDSSVCFRKRPPVLA